VSDIPIQPDEVTPPAPGPETPDVPQPVEGEQPAAPEAAAVSPPVPVELPAGEVEAVPPPAGMFRGTGRRKSSIARVRLVTGGGKVLINKRELEKYFTEPQDQAAVTAPLEASGKLGMWDVLVHVHGGGHTGQAGAVKLGVARALVAADASVEPTLRDGNYLTRDSRRVERKKYGRRKARRRFQFSKR
jgi:small subunit ribosomal protein S9